MAVSTALSSSREALVGTWLRSQFSENFMVSPWWARRTRLGLRIWKLSFYANCFRKRTSFSKNARRSLTP